MLNGGGLNFKNLGIFVGCVLPNIFNAKYNNQRKSHGCFNFFSTRCRKISAKKSCFFLHRCKKKNYVLHWHFEKKNWFSYNSYFFPFMKIDKKKNQLFSSIVQNIVTSCYIHFGIKIFIHTFIEKYIFWGLIRQIQYFFSWANCS